ncbi:SDR family oxidoreductase [Oleiagrimonas sp. C23AA]|uniref:SDR family oxidoreductase n=1 Tax=Oleiagrimonas sp. C23AA TaxID=2719047 RepID=UPI00141E8856|nr:SDR family oxidoreductase [Oleiagrimonas sp. C23AA]NII09280.1 SDR family oxidoreductase [Oleiagrimonas sp. C23AA]
MVKPVAAPPVRAFPSEELAQRVVMVTGGAQGVGRGIVHAVLAAGGSVAVGDIDAEAGKACVAELGQPDRVMFKRLDVSRETSVKAFVAAVLERFGRLDGLVNNAGIAGPDNGPLDTLELAEWRRRLGTNLDGAFLCAKHTLPALREARGAIVNIASSRAMQSEPHTEAYAASKGALVAFTHALAVSEGPVVRVNCISPGWIEVSAWKKPGQRKHPRLSERDHAQHPVGRVGVPEDIGTLASFLLSSRAGFMTGENIRADGGIAKRMYYEE